MPWEKTFDIDDAIDRATSVFWAKGYESSSLSDLLKAIGINKGSFYNAFGSKKALFVRALLKYDREQRHDGLVELEALNDPIVAITGLFDAMVEKSLSDTELKGCFIINTAVDLPNHDKDVQEAVKKGLNDIEAFFTRQITQGLERELISKHVDPVMTAKALLSLLVGLRVLARGTFDESGLRAIRNQALQLIHP